MHSLRRVRRRNADMAHHDARDQRRFACGASACGWQGLLQRDAPPVTAPAAALDAGAQPAAGERVDAAATAPQHAWRPAWRWLLAAAAAVGVPAAIVLAGSLGHWLERRALQQVPPGTSHDGRALRVGHPLQAWQAVDPQDADGLPDAPPLALRSHCAWGQPGRNPYQGSTEQALRMARLPPEVVRQIAALRQQGRPSGRVEIRNSGITTLGDGRRFNARSFAMTFGHTLCVDARVNFAPGHVEQGDLFEARDAAGRLHSVMVPDVCGNVSVLGADGQRVGRAQLASAMAAQGGPQRLAPAWAAEPEGQVAGARGEADGSRPADGEAGDKTDTGPSGGEGAGEGMPPATAADSGTPAAAGPAADGRSPGSRVFASLPGQHTAASPPALPGREPGGLVRLSQVLGYTEGEGPGGAPGTSGTAAGGGAEAHEVPEPGTLAAVAAALAALALQRRWRRRPHG